MRTLPLPATLLFEHDVMRFVSIDRKVGAITWLELHGKVLLFPSLYDGQARGLDGIIEEELGALTLRRIDMFIDPARRCSRRLRASLSSNDSQVLCPVENTISAYPTIHRCPHRLLSSISRFCCSTRRPTSAHDFEACAQLK